MAATTRLRIVVLTLVIGLVSLAIGARLCQLQVVRCDGLRARADDQHHRRIEVPAMRGRIVDRHGSPLAMSRQTRSLYVHAERVEQPERAAALLAPLLGIEQRRLLDALSSDKPFVYLKRFVEPALVDELTRLDLPFDDGGPFGFQSEPSRVYPWNALAVHVVGYASIDGDGLEGVEAVFDEQLKGDPTVYLISRDAHARGPRELLSAPKKKSRDVVLSIDRVLQYMVERELERAMRSTRAAAASAVLIDPGSGEILALANRPAANANRFGRASRAARRNRAVVDQYEPGSTFKIIPLAAALELGRVRSGQRIFCERGTWRTGGRVIHDVSPQGMLTPAEIIVNSSNIGMAKIAMSMRPHELREVIERFGFGSRIGVELPGESPGLLREVSQWSGFSQASLAFGQEIAVTSLQMATAFAVIANDGVLVPPRVVLGARDSEGRLLEAAAPPAQRVIRADTARTIARMLEGVVRNGTGRRAAVDGYRVAGKSGTAQKALSGVPGYSESDYVASFGGFAPIDEPRLALLVVIDSPRGEEYQGGQVAAPVFGRMMTEALRHLRVPNDDPSAPRTSVVRQQLGTAPAQSRVGRSSS